ncbi:hypothetical protein R3P38DRAFT_2598161 [Favolaschia claudopus]|uniref:F-box domain-containing protein n=1 Tax=Favolaschia claudopus TaxID=2862362 RepID=A0AAW0E6P9_9AGAR
MLSTLAADRKRIADIDAKLLVNGDGCPELLFEKEAAQKRLDDYKYPVLTLPNEIVSEIFELLVPLYPVCPPQAGSSSPTLLSHICSTWRQIAIATPRLWRAIAVSFSRGSKSMASRRQVELAEAWLRRSGCCPLSLEIRRDAFRELQKKGSGGHGQRIYTIMAAHRDRWEHLRVSSSVIGRQVFRGPMPLLRSLCLDDGRDSPATAFEQAPLLRSLSFQVTSYSYFNNPLATVTLPWLQFTSLALDTKSPSFAPPLEQLQNLTHLELNISDYFRKPRIRFARVQSLVLKDERRRTRRDENHEILRNLTTPALRHLTVWTFFIDGWRSDSAIGGLMSFLTASACKLEELCIVVTDNRQSSCDLECDLPHYRRAFPTIPEISFKKEEVT